MFDGDGHPVIEKGGSRIITGGDPDPMVISVKRYQVWSSVLGSSLTTVEPDGDQIETKVFAGGTHIATQDAQLSQIVYTTADPVTGTVGKLFGSGSTTDVEESEPLGQKIETVDPGTGYPASYEDVLGVARGPEWQCLPGFKEFYGGFNGMPVHCKKAALEDKNFSTPAAFGYSVGESDPKNVSKLVDSPLPSIKIPVGGYSPSDLALTFAAKATDKPSKEKNHPCDWDQDGRGDCAVTIMNPGPDPLDSISAENGDDDWRSPFHFFSSDQKLSDKDCDAKMSRIFGGNVKAMESAGDINGINRYQYPDGTLHPGHSATPANDKPVWREQEMGGPKVKDLQRGGIIHTYTDGIGSPRTDVSLTAPGGWAVGYSDFIGGNPITGLRYSNGITIEFVHVGTTNRSQVPTVPARGRAGSLQTIGYVGGAGSTSPTSKTYHHTHIVFYSNKSTYTTIDPRKLFCGW